MYRNLDIARTGTTTVFFNINRVHKGIPPNPSGLDRKLLLKEVSTPFFNINCISSSPPVFLTINALGESHKDFDVAATAIATTFTEHFMIRNEQEISEKEEHAFIPHSSFLSLVSTLNFFIKGSTFGQSSEAKVVKRLEYEVVRGHNIRIKLQDPPASEIVQIFAPAGISTTSDNLYLVGKVEFKQESDITVIFWDNSVALLTLKPRLFKRV